MGAASTLGPISDAIRNFKRPEKKDGMTNEFVTALIEAAARLQHDGLSNDQILAYLRGAYK